LYYGAGQSEKNNPPQNRRKFGNVIRVSDELDAGGGKVIYVIVEAVLL
jgi:hypothetical protein